nr:hypothetical protein BaRGS_034243 [Batillaria attramentaria]
MNSSDSCPETHFRCPGESNHCLPVFVRCNGVYDCTGHEDEAECDKFTCPGVWRLSVVNLSTLTNILVCVCVRAARLTSRYHYVDRTGPDATRVQ